MKNFLLFTICLFSLTLIAQRANVELVLDIQPGPIPNLKTDSLDLLFSFPCIAFEGEFGIEYDDDNIYTSSWTSDSIAKYNVDGNLIEKFVISEVGHIRDMAYDGEFFYGGTNDQYFYVIDMVTRALVLKADIPFRIQSIAFDNSDYVFWVCEEGSALVYQIDDLGTNLGYITVEGFDTINITGLAIDEVGWEGPFLWVFCQDNSRSLLIKYDIYGKSQVGYEIDLSSLVSENSQSGGLYFVEEWNSSYIGGLIQDQLIFALDLDYANQLVTTDENIMLTKFDIYPNPVADRLSIYTSYNENQNIVCRILNQSGQLMYEKKLSSNLLNINISDFPRGTYFVTLTGSEGYSFTKKFIK